MFIGVQNLFYQHYHLKTLSIANCDSYTSWVMSPLQMAIFSLLIFSSRVGNIEFNDLVCLLCTFNLLCCVCCSLDQHFRIKVSTYGYLDEIRLNFPAFNIFIKNNCRVHSISAKLTLHIKHSKIPTRRIDARLRCSTFF